MFGCGLLSKIQWQKQKKKGEFIINGSCKSWQESGAVLVPALGVWAQLPSGGWRGEIPKGVISEVFSPLWGSSFNAEPFSVLKSEVLGRKLIDLFSKSITEAITTNATEMFCKYNVRLTTLPIT